MTTACIAVLGGSFDPVHNGHVALAHYFATLLTPDQVRIIPAGQPWQRQALQACGADRVAMARLAFQHLPVAVRIDEQEVQRDGASYTIDTLRSLRAELGPDVAIAFLIGADQLQQLQTWKNWRELFAYAHVCAASRPGFAMATNLSPEIAHEYARRRATPEQIRTTPYGLMYLADSLQVDVSATGIRNALGQGASATSLVPPAVLDYIKQHHLYEN